MMIRFSDLEEEDVFMGAGYVAVSIIALTLAAPVAHQDEAEPKPDAEALLTQQIIEHLEDITYAKIASYDGKILEVEYRYADRFFQDVEDVKVPRKENAVFYNGAMANKLNEDQKLYSCFEGRNEGSFFLRPHFKGSVKVTAKTKFNFVAHGASLLVLAHASAKEFIGSNLGVHLLHKRRGVKTYGAKSKEFQRDPTAWLTKMRDLDLGVELDAKSGEATTIGQHRRSKKIKKPPLGGRVGFVWKNTGFTLRTLKIRGELDREWAKKALAGARTLKEY